MWNRRGIRARPSHDGAAAAAGATTEVLSQAAEQSEATAARIRRWYLALQVNGWGSACDNEQITVNASAANSLFLGLSRRSLWSRPLPFLYLPLQVQQSGPLGPKPLTPLPTSPAGAAAWDPSPSPHFPLTLQVQQPGTQAPHPTSHLPCRASRSSLTPWSFCT